MSFFDRFKKPNKEKKQVAPKKEVKVEKKKEAATLKPKAEGTAPALLKEKKETKTSKKKSDDTKNAYRVLLSPVVTEKATTHVSENKYEFEVASDTNKVEIKKAIKNVYGFNPVAVNIIIVRGKKTSSGRVQGKRSNWKKAIVTLKKGDKIEIYEGV
jgi:large subunit ribosomal protein L23